MTPDELRALADDLEVRPPNQHDVMATWARRKVESAARLRLLEIGSSLARDHAALLDWAARTTEWVNGVCLMLVEVEGESGLTDSGAALLSEWAEMQERPLSARCNLCGENVAPHELLAHLTDEHGLDVEIETWPDGEPVVVDETLQPDDLRRERPS